jgi:hypothetical protein
MRILLSLALTLFGSLAFAQTPYPQGATPVTVSATGTTAATSATMPAPSSGLNYLCGFSIRALATAAVNGAATVSGVSGGTLTFQQFVAPLASGIGITERDFNPCLAGVYNTAIVVNSIAPGSGGAVSVVVWGYSRQ